MVVPADEWVGARVLDVGCGMGRNALSALHLGATEVHAIDVDEATVAVARENLAGDPAARVRLGSAYDHGDADFDIVMCIGVLHHLGDPTAAVFAMASHVRPGGDLVLWVYGSHGVGRFHRVLDPIRSVTSRLPTRVVWHLAGPATSFLRLLLRPLAASSIYARRFLSMPRDDARVIVFDQLIPRTSRYYSRDDLEELCRLPGFGPAEMLSVNDISWSIRLRRDVCD